MSLQSEREKVNRTLSDNGLPSLDDDPKPLLQILAKNVQTDKQLRNLLNSVEVPMRYIAYETMRPLLRFTPKPFEQYLAELGQVAEREQLPIKDETYPGGYRPFKVAEIGEKAESVLASNELVMTCSKCTREETFHGNTIVDATIKAREKGWVRDLKREVEICPKCPAVRDA